MKKNSILIAVSKSISFNLFLSDIFYSLKKKYKLSILISDPKKILVNDCDKININLPKKIYSYFNLFSLFKNIISININLFKYRKNILFLHTPNISFFLRFFIFFKFKKIVYFVHGFRFHKNEKKFKYYFYYFIEKLLSFRTDYYITINNEDDNIVKNKFKKDSIKVNGVGIKIDSLIFKKKININSKIKIGVLSAYRKNKGYRKLLKIAKILGNNYLIDCYGYDYDSKFYHELKKHKSDNLTLNNFTDDIYNKIDSFDLLLHLSEREGLCVSIIQSLSRGVPVIAHNIRGVNDLVSNNFNGFLFDINDDLINIISIIKKLNDDRYLLEKFSYNSISSIDETFSSDYICNTILNYFNKIK